MEAKSEDFNRSSRRKEKGDQNEMWQVVGFPAGSAEKNLTTMQETQEMWVWSLDCEDPLEERMATHSSILAWRIPWTEEHGRLQSMGLQLDMTEVTKHTRTHGKL